MWDHPNPVYVDFETQSAADIKEVGGRLYAYHPSTRVLILSLCDRDTFHVWIPNHIKVDSSYWNDTNLWPYQLKPALPVRLYRGETPPQIVQDLIESKRPMIAHNAYGFDRFIWDRFIGGKPFWMDTLPLAKATGRMGKLDQLGKALLGQGKDRAAKLMQELCVSFPGIPRGWSYPLIKAGDLEAFTRYAVADVEILRRLWAQFENVPVEADVIELHDRINDRGIAVDIPLMTAIENLSEYSVGQAADEIARITDGKLHAGNIRSTKQVHEWLQSYGVYITAPDAKTGEEKPCLRKEIVQKALDSKFLVSNNLEAVKEIPPVVISVLKLRLKALRITEAKLKRAKLRAWVDKRIRDLFAYHHAHPGRWGSLGVQFHNLPRPRNELVKAYNKDGDTYLEDIIRVLQKPSNDIKEVYSSVQSVIDKLIPTNPEKLVAYNRNPVTIDDVNSALIRPSFMAGDGKVLGLVDYSQVECRGVAWMIDENKLLKVFADGKDVYKDFASIMFGVPISEVTDTMRQTAKPVILGCGYGMGATKLRVYAANMGVDLEKAGVTSDYCIDKFRDTYTRICGFKPDKRQSFRTDGLWHRLERAVKDTVRDRTHNEAGKCQWIMDGKDLICVLPSGRYNYYPDARIEDVVPAYCYTMGLPLTPKATVVYTSPHGPKSLWGGLIAENCCQAICRDILAAAMLRLDEAGFYIVLHVHDEIGCELDSIKQLPQMIRIMSEVPDWAIGFPIEVEGFCSPRFVKSPMKGYKKMTTAQAMELAA